MSVRARVFWVAALVLVFGFLAASNLATPEQRAQSAWLPDSGLRLGLDLRGGVHLVLGPDLESAIAHELGATGDRLAVQLEDDEILDVGKPVVVGHTLRVTAQTTAAADALRELLSDHTDYTIVNVRESEAPDGTLFSLMLDDEHRDFVRERAMQQVLEVLRRRIDDPATGIPESVITKQGRERVLVQIPGVARVPTELITGKGHLEFKIVEDQAANEELLRARYPDGLPEGTVISLQMDETGEDVITAYLLPETPALTGDQLVDAASQFDGARGEWLINFQWSDEAAERFADLTGRNINNQLAILLDGQVQSAPTIQAKIYERGKISGTFTQQEAADLAVILRAGSLPIDIRIEEERTVGPALGQDSIDRGLRASLTGLALIMVFVIFYYRLSGLYASLGLVLNLTLLLGVMTLFGATLTLPGIAGLVLTVGMAVDANVIIFERIREELRNGRAARTAIVTGFQKARWTILDANITTLLTAIILFKYGTGPIKGFAVTLSVGILTSVFSALVITRLLYEWRPGRVETNALSI